MNTRQYVERLAHMPDEALAREYVEAYASNCSHLLLADELARRGVSDAELAGIVSGADISDRAVDGLQTHELYARLEGAAEDIVSAIREHRKAEIIATLEKNI